MTAKQFQLVAEVRSANLPDMRAALGQLLPGAEVEDTELGVRVHALLEGENAADLNRTLLSGLRRIAKRTSLRAEWTSEDESARFFDYVRKSSLPSLTP